LNIRLFTVDTNILIYTVTPGDRRREPAISIVERAALGRGLLTLQSLGEFFVAVTRKRMISRSDAAVQVRRWIGAFPPPLTPDTEAVDHALEASIAGRFGYWDAVLVASAGLAGCTAVISEDMAPGATLAGARVVPAFAGDAISPEALAVLG